VSLSRLRGVALNLQEEWPKQWAQMEAEGSAPDVDRWKRNVLEAYLSRIARIREDTATINVQGETLEENRDLTRGVLDQLENARGYLAEVELYYNFDGRAIADEKSRLEQAIQFRSFQHESIVKDITERDARTEAEEAARIAREEAERIRTQRNEEYSGLIEEFTDVLRCKGDLPDNDIARLAATINGGEIVGGKGGNYQTSGMRTVYPDQFEVDRPGIVAALRGCVEQRIAVRAPDRARQVRDRLAAIMDNEPRIANLVIEDLDPCAQGNLEGRGNRNGSW
ncbi:MAG: hypothetical protein WD994_00480, partial [Pseudomonadales bacterium]